MSTVAFLASVVDPRVASSAAKVSLSCWIFKLYFFVWILEYFLTLDMEYLHYHNLPYEQVLLLKVHLKRVELLLPTDMEAERVYWILLGFSKFVLILFKKGYQY